jgi:hypothetical protein
MSPVWGIRAPEGKGAAKRHVAVKRSICVPLVESRPLSYREKIHPKAKAMKDRRGECHAEKSSKDGFLVDWHDGPERIPGTSENLGSKFSN